jgi:hypothetical protein
MSVELRPLRPDEFEGWFAGWSAWYAHGSLGLAESFVSMGKGL